MSTRSIGLSDELYRYLLSVTVTPEPMVQRLREETLQSVGFNMQISPEQAQFMELLIRLSGAERALEIGTFTGYSALTIARALPVHGRLTACDVSEEWTAIARKYWKEAGVENKVDLIIAPALDSLDQLIADGASGSYGFAFIDADKGNYLNYYERCVELVYSGGVICIDNTLWGGAVADAAVTDQDTQAIRAVNQFVFEDERVHSSLIPVGDGVHLALKK